MESEKRDEYIYALTIRAEQVITYTLMFQAQRKRTPAKGGDGDESSDAQGNFRDTV